jgi:SAM-dependent methyltransferase
MQPPGNDYSPVPATGHPRDITDADLDLALGTASRPDLLRELVDLSRRTFEFYTSHYPHTINYPWIVEGLEKLSSGSRVLDIGTGVSPVPLLLAQKGMFVDCVDKHPVIRTPPATPDWNEWGFFNYGTLHQNLTAHHCDVADFEPSSSYEAIYSISSLAHFPREARESTLTRCRDWLRPEGLLLLAIDVIPSSDFLWNRSEGLEVEPPIRHGTVDSVLRQLAELGFQIKESRIARTIPHSRTDLFFVACNHRGIDKRNLIDQA